jgi:hypothetical protein
MRELLLGVGNLMLRILTASAVIAKLNEGMDTIGLVYVHAYK